MAKKSSIFPIIAIVLCVVLASSALRGRKEAADSSCEHIYGEAVTLKQAKCEEEGATKKECLVCGEIKVEKIPSKGGHVYVEKEVLIEPTCAQAGAVNKECAVCREKMIDRLPLTDDHVYDAGVETEDSILYTCTICGNTKTGEKHQHEDLDFSGACDICDAPFYALANATEVDVVDGEYVAGNWYRIYRPEDTYIEIHLSAIWQGGGEDGEVVKLMANSLNPEWIFNGRGYLMMTAPEGLTFKEMKSYITDEYIDVYLETGVYEVDWNGEYITTSIDETTSISLRGSGEYIKRLVLD